MRLSERQMISDNRARHGHSRTANHSGTSYTYLTWSAIKLRCYNKRQKAFKDYGARGIKMCKRWRYSFEAFLDDMGLRPKGTTIDRIVPKRGYRPGNCRWATPLEQAAHRSNSKLNFSKARRIKRLISAGLSNTQIANKFSVTPGMIGLIRRGRCWKDTDGKRDVK